MTSSVRTLAVFVAALAIGGISQADTSLDALEKDVTAKADKLKSLSAKVSVVTGANEMSGTIVLDRSGGKTKYRMELLSTGKPGEDNAEAFRHLEIDDGEFSYSLLEGGGEPMAFKGRSHSFNPVLMGSEWFKAQRETSVIRRLPDEKLGSEVVYVLVITPKKPEEGLAYRERRFVSKTNGVLVMAVTQWEDEQRESTMTIADLKTDVAIDPAQCVFNVPPGVEVFDMTKDVADRPAHESDESPSAKSFPPPKAVPPRPPLPERDHREFASHYLEPDAHLLLARKHVDAGHKLLAFMAMESARHRFGDALFNRSHRKFFSRPAPIDAGEAAETRLLANLEKMPGDVTSMTALADLYAVRGDFEKAIDFARRTCRAEPAEYAHVETLGMIAMEAGRSEVAQTAYERFLDENPDSLVARVETLFERNTKADGEVSQTLDTLIEEHPKVAELYLARAGYLAEKGDHAASERDMKKAVELAPRNASAAGTLGRFFLKIKHDKQAALDQYLDTYFLAPHYYDGEFAESRVRTLLRERTEDHYAYLRAGKSHVGELTKGQDAFVTTMALAELADDWRAEYTDDVVALLAHPSQSVRWAATQALGRHVDESFDARLEELLKDPHPYRRGCAAYIAAMRWKDKCVEILRPLLSDPAQLVVYDAASALMLSELPDAPKVVGAVLSGSKDPHVREFWEHAGTQDVPSVDPRRG